MSIQLGSQTGRPDNKEENLEELICNLQMTRTVDYESQPILITNQPSSNLHLLNLQLHSYHEISVTTTN